MLHMCHEDVSPDLDGRDIPSNLCPFPPRPQDPRDVAWSGSEFPSLPTLLALPALTSGGSPLSLPPVSLSGATSSSPTDLSAGPAENKEVLGMNPGALPDGKTPTREEDADIEDDGRSEATSPVTPEERRDKPGGHRTHEPPCHTSRGEVWLTKDPRDVAWSGSEFPSLPTLLALPALTSGGSPLSLPPVSLSGATSSSPTDLSAGPAENKEVLGMNPGALPDGKTPTREEDADIEDDGRSEATSPVTPEERRDKPGGHRTHEPPCHTSRGEVWLTKDPRDVAWSGSEFPSLPTLLALPALTSGGSPLSLPPVSLSGATSSSPTDLSAGPAENKEVLGMNPGALPDGKTPTREEDADIEDDGRSEATSPVTPEERRDKPGGHRTHEPPCHTSRGEVWLTKVLILQQDQLACKSSIINNIRGRDRDLYEVVDELPSNPSEKI
ncbi:uncharacterized protein LOC144752430 [Lissotriton helveticus]